MPSDLILSLNVHNLKASDAKVDHSSLSAWVMIGYMTNLFFEGATLDEKLVEMARFGEKVRQEAEKALAARGQNKCPDGAACPDQDAHPNEGS